MARYVGQAEETFDVEAVNRDGRPVSEARISLTFVTPDGRVRGSTPLKGPKATFPLSMVADVRKLALIVDAPGYEYYTETVPPGTQLVGRTFRTVLRRPVLVRVGVPLLAMTAVLGLGTVLFGKR
jgi:hypothetical protein